MRPGPKGEKGNTSFFPGVGGVCKLYDIEQLNKVCRYETPLFELETGGGDNCSFYWPA